MEVKIKHNINWWDGGTGYDEIIRGFAERLQMKEGRESLYYFPSYIQYVDVSMKQFKTLKRRLNNSKKLNDIKIDVIANNVH
jgi:hypothetical protein